MRLLISFSLLVTSAFAQIVGASLGGTVRDESGAMLPQASVSVRNIETGAERKLATDEEGRYAAPSIGIGRYEVTVSKSGFHTQVKTGIELSVGQKATVDVTLSVGELKQALVVEEKAAAVEVSTQETAGLVGERQVKDLPLNGRSYDQLMTLNAGVVNYTAERTGGVGTSNSSVGSMFSVSGRRPQENLFLLNGIEYTGASLINNTPGGASGQLLGVDAVREFNVVSGAYSAQYGKRPGGQVSIVTAGGTNQFHGTAYEFLRNSAFDARNFFDQQIPEFQRNEFGTAAGGPIQRDKLFIFGNYEGFRQNLGLSDVTLVPDNASRAAAVASVQPLLALWPVANGPELGGGIAEAFSNPRQHIREDFGTTRFDANLTSKDTFFAVYTVDDSAAHTPTINPLSTVIENLREQVASVEEQHIFSPSVLNTARFGFSRAGYFFTGEVPVNVPGWVQGAPIGAIVIGGGTASNGASQVSLAGANNGSNLTTARNLFTWDDHVGILHGKHQITAGVWLQRMQANDNLVQSQYGQASFSSLTSFLQGTIATFSVAPSPTPVGWRQVEAAGFVDDSIKLRPNLEVRVGFRFESTNGWSEAHDRASNYLFDGNGVIQANPQVGNSVFTVNRAKFLPEPRVGLAWDPFGKSKTVIRAGFGVYKALLDNLDYRLDQAAPFNTILALKNIPVAGLLIAPGSTQVAGSKISPAGVQPDAYTPTVLTWNLKVEQEILRNTSLGIGYLGSHGYHEMLSVDANEPFPALLNGALYYPTGAPLANSNVTNTTTWMSEGVSSYQGLSVDVNHRFAGGLQVRGVYTFSKSLDDGTAWNSSVGANAPGFVMYPGNPKQDWGPATTDTRHLASINGLWALPFGRNGQAKLAHRLFGGWTLSGIETIQSGFPFTAQLGYNPTNNGDSRNPIRPSVNPAFHGPVILGGPNQYFNPNAFLPPASGTYGNVGRDTLVGPGLAELDMSLARTVAVKEKIKLELRAEFFNLLNRANFSTPNAVVFTSASTTPAPTAGVITATSTSSRQVQFGMKWKW
jgi:Carboxypeptidase regulatory-like domain